MLRHCIHYFRESLDETYTHEDVVYLCIFLCPLWFFGNILYNYSLLLTSISSSTVISNTSGVYTLLFSWLLQVEEMTAGKIVGVFLCIVGVILISLQDDESQDSSGTQHSIVGDIVALLGAILYALFTTVLKLKVRGAHSHVIKTSRLITTNGEQLRKDEEVSMQLVLGYTGLLIALVFLPVLIAMVWYVHDSYRLSPTDIIRHKRFNQ